MTTPTSIEPAMSVSLKTLRYLGYDPNRVETQALVAVAQRYRLDPLLGEVQLIETRGGKPKVYVTRDGLLSVAHRSGQLDGIVVQDERRSSRDDGWTCYVSVWRKDMSHPFTFGAQCRDSEPQAKSGHGPEMALARAERRALKRAFNVQSHEIDDIDETDGVDVPAGTVTEPLSAPIPEPAPVPPPTGTKRGGKSTGPRTPVPAPVDTPALTVEDVPRVPPPDSESMALAIGRQRNTGQAAAHRVIGALDADAREAFLTMFEIEDFADPWPSDAVDYALERPFEEPAEHLPL